MATFLLIMHSAARIWKLDCASISIQYATWSHPCMVLIARNVVNCHFLPFISKIRPASPIKLCIILICSIWTSTYIKMKKSYRVHFSLECPMYRIWPHPPLNCIKGGGGEISDKIKQKCLFIDDCSGKSSTARLHFHFGILIYTH